ncbi:MAG: Smr/MutS family protein [Chlorobiales bacterium]|nr:Smr/MutS family protein [Chlorobiales bacterium]
MMTDEVTRKKLDFDKVISYASSFCLSDMGRDALADTVPPQKRALLEEELKRVLELRIFLEEGNPLPFSVLPDTRVLLRKLDTVDTYLEPKELLAIHDLLHASVQLRKYMFQNRTVYPSLNNLTIQLWLEKSLQYEIMRVVDEQAQVRDTASDGLFALRRELNDCRETLRKKMIRLLKRCQQNGWLMEDTVALKNGRQVLGLRVEYKYKLPGFIQDYSDTGQTVFIEPAETLELSNRIQDLEINERREVERILRETTGHISRERENVQHNQDLMAVFDSLYGRAQIARNTGSVLPQIGKGKSLRIVKGFHPWLLVTHRNKKEKIFPLDMELGEQERVLVISGPNAGGKSVAMKTAGLLCCMLAHGYLVPCSESSVFPLFEEMFIEIGDEQSIENDLSTFSSHLEHIRTILDAASPGSLVLIDELCSGTDVEEGSAIARSVIEELLVKGAKVIVTTHLGELKAYAHEREGVVNGAMDFDRSSLSPTFRFLKGLPGNSFAFAMMQRMGFGRELLDRAESYLDKGRAGLDNMLDDLGKSLEANEELTKVLEQEREFLATERKRLHEKDEELKSREREVKMKAGKEMIREIEKAKKAIREVVQEVRKQPEEKIIEAARNELDKRKKALLREEKSITDEMECSLRFDPSIREGDAVRVLATNTTGEVVSLQGEDAVVQCGTFRLSTSLKNIERISKTRAKKLERTEGSVSGEGIGSAHAAALESTRLDLRGLLGDEAVQEVERFIDKLRLNNISKATIIHGKGTGALRQKVADCLKRHPAVKSFKLGEWSEGGAGVTIIEI